MIDGAKVGCLAIFLGEPVPKRTFRREKNRIVAFRHLQHL
jgi:hypothetical protein